MRELGPRGALVEIERAGPGRVDGIPAIEAGAWRDIIVVVSARGLM